MNDNPEHEEELARAQVLSEVDQMWALLRKHSQEIDTMAQFGPMSHEGDIGRVIQMLAIVVSLELKIRDLGDD